MANTDEAVHKTKRLTQMYFKKCNYVLFRIHVKATLQHKSIHLVLCIIMLTPLTCRKVFELHKLIIQYDKHPVDISIFSVI